MHPCFCMLVITSYYALHPCQESNQEMCITRNNYVHVNTLEMGTWSLENQCNYSSTAKPGCWEICTLLLCYIRKGYRTLILCNSEKLKAHEKGSHNPSEVIYHSLGGHIRGAILANFRGIFGNWGSPLTDFASNFESITSSSGHFAPLSCLLCNVSHCCSPQGPGSNTTQFCPTY